MKFYNKILEAINRGIQLALDDLEDNEPNSSLSQKSDVIDSEDVIKQRYEFDKPYINLGLPSETLWCKCNLGAENEYDYGDYYAWGELVTKFKYTKENYTYNTTSNQLPHKCDVATQTLGENYAIPTKEQWNELLKYTYHKWFKNYKGTSINGYLFTSKINGKSMFIPAAGYRNDSNLCLCGYSGLVWSSSHYTGITKGAWCIDFYSDNINIYHDRRYYGLSVRPVLMKK